jgi:hypothetical protein
MNARKQAVVANGLGLALEGCSEKWIDLRGNAIDFPHVKPLTFNG